MIPPEPGAFGKTAPADGAVTAVNPTISWEASSDAAEYWYCVNPAIDNDCGAGWTSAGTSTGAVVNGLSYGTTYYWQVYAANFSGNTFANSGTWWSFTTLPPPPGAFGKTAPVQGSSQPVNPILSWGAASGASGYEYCYDTVDNSSCDTSWISTGSSLSIGLSGLSNNTTIYWQVRAINSGGRTKADGGTWWNFTTVPLAPGAFGKTSPANGANAAVNPTLAWNASDYADSYEYCVDGSNNNACDTFWISAGASTSAGLSGLVKDATYYWQVRSNNISGTASADGGTWWIFKARVPTFSDVPVSHSLWEYIEAFYNAGITGGCGFDPLIYCPEQNVTRAAMAVFLLRAKYGSGYAPPASDHFFSDLPVAGKEWQEAWVDQVYREGITTGCATSPLRFCPENSVTRAAMAVFILRALEGASYTPPAASHFFSDMPVAGKEWMEPWVDEVYRRGITTGCGTGPLIFCPETAVKRQAMAAFIVRAFNLPLP